MASRCRRFRGGRGGAAGRFEVGHAKLGDEGAVLVFAGVFLGEEFVAGENGVGAGEEAEGLGLIREFDASCGEADEAGGHEDARGGDHTDELEGVDGRLLGEGGAFDALEGEAKFGRTFWGQFSLELWQQRFHDRAGEFRALLTKETTT